MYESTAFVLGLGLRQTHLLGHDLHGAARARGGKADVVAVDERRAPVESLVTGIADETQPGVGAPVDNRQRTTQRLRIARGDLRAPGVELQRVDAAPRRIVDFRDEPVAAFRRTE